jgi:hypothetical protein
MAACKTGSHCIELADKLEINVRQWQTKLENTVSG